MDIVAGLRAELAEAHARISDLEAVLGLSDDNIGVAFRLSSSLTKLLGCLLATPNVTPDMVTVRLNICSDAKVAIHRLRHVLKGYCEANGITPTIEIHSQRGLGYWIEPADKKTIRLITQGVTSHDSAPPEELGAVA